MCTNVYLLLTATILLRTIVIGDQENTECGKQLDFSSGSGYDTHLYEYPWLVLLQENGSNLCEGVLISSRYVLTAAHCLTRKLPTSIWLGEYDTSSAIDCVENSKVCNSPINMTYEKIIWHPNYSARTHTDDIALIKLEKDVSFTDFIRPICLPNALEQVNVGEHLYLASWRNKAEKKFSNVKLKGKITILDQHKCSMYQNRFNFKKYFCAGDVTNACIGLSGSPLMKFNKDTEKWYTEGILEFGTLICSYDKPPDAYLRVSEYVDWIKNEIKK